MEYAWHKFQAKVNEDLKIEIDAAFMNVQLKKIIRSSIEEFRGKTSFGSQLVFVLNC